MIALGEEVRHGDGVHMGRVGADALGHDQPVQIGAHRQTDGRPGRVRDARDVGHARQAQQQPGRHVRGLGAHRRGQRAQLAAAQVEVAHVGRALGVDPADGNHARQIDDDGNQHQQVCSRHSSNPPLL